MKKTALFLAIILVLSAPLTASAATRTESCKPNLTITGTTATCNVMIAGGNMTDTIHVTMRLMHRSAYIAAWTATGTGYVSLSKTATVSPGNTYTLVVQVTINGVTEPPVAVSKTC